VCGVHSMRNSFRTSVGALFESFKTSELCDKIVIHDCIATVTPAARARTSMVIILDIRCRQADFTPTVVANDLKLSSALLEAVSGY
jgi:hypothetical protein